LKRGVILFAHGSRDPGWARPFEQLAATLRRHFDGPVALAYLELMKPSLGETIDALAGEVSSIRIVPVFLGAGGHVKEDLPRLVESARARNASLSISIDPPIGEQAAVVDAIAAAISRP